MIYELEGVDQKKRDVAVILNGAGKVEEIETEFAVEEVRATVMMALQAKLPTFEITAVTEIQEGKKIVAFDFAGTRPSSNKSIGICVSADGKSVDSASTSAGSSRVRATSSQRSLRKRDRSRCAAARAASSLTPISAVIWPYGARLASPSSAGRNASN